MPQPVRKFLGSRIIASLILLSLPLLYGLGIIRVEWVENRPRVTVNWKRAAEVKDEAVGRATDLANENNRPFDNLESRFTSSTGDASPGASFFPATNQSGTSQSWSHPSAFSTDSQPQSGPFFQPSATETTATPEESTHYRPFAKIRRRLDSTRR